MNVLIWHRLYRQQHVQWVEGTLMVRGAIHVAEMMFPRQQLSIIVKY